VLPHAFPFRFVAGERAGDGTASGVTQLAWTGGATYGRDGGDAPATLLVEMMAQAVLAALPASKGDDAAAGPAGGQATRPALGLLAGLDSVQFHAPVRAGDRLEGTAELVGGFGRLIKARVVLRRVGETAAVAEGDLLLAMEG
jgi:3-hydroxymyristoyl/3-hydroxydecanoyl-(acyl carrier protein) dehydratase